MRRREAEVDVHAGSIVALYVQAPKRGTSKRLPECPLQEEALSVVQLTNLPSHISLGVCSSDIARLTQPVKGRGRELLLVPHIDEGTRHVPNAQKSTHVGFAVGDIRLGHAVITANQVVAPVRIGPALGCAHDIQPQEVLRKRPLTNESVQDGWLKKTDLWHCLLPMTTCTHSLLG